MNVPLFAAFAALCAVVGATLGKEAVHIWVVALYVVTAVLFLQLGYAAALFTRG
jgi:hypothetical protein